MGSNNSHQEPEKFFKSMDCCSGCSNSDKSNGHFFKKINCCQAQEDNDQLFKDFWKDIPVKNLKTKDFLKGLKNMPNSILSNKEDFINNIANKFLKNSELELSIVSIEIIRNIFEIFTTDIDHIKKNSLKNFICSLIFLTDYTSDRNNFLIYFTKVVNIYQPDLIVGQYIEKSSLREMISVYILVLSYLCIDDLSYKSFNPKNFQSIFNDYFSSKNRELLIEHIFSQYTDCIDLNDFFKHNIHFLNNDEMIRQKLMNMNVINYNKNSSNA